MQLRLGAAVTLGAAAVAAISVLEMMRWRPKI
jgi:hypothetical protein